MTSLPRAPLAAPPAATPAHLAELRTRLLRYYRAGHRDLPWRGRGDAYAVWVSEIMLQQTQVDTVVPRFLRFMQLYPTVQALAAATETAVCEAWAGLGYYRRARFMHQAAQRLVQDHAGVLPRTVAGLLELPGIGRYTAGAIASIAYNEPVPLVDGNVERVLSRLFALSAAPQSRVGKQHLWHLAAQLVCPKHPGQLNQALMELGALICTPRAPRCAQCPVRPLCAAHAGGAPEQYPSKDVRPAKKAMHMAFAYLPTRNGVYLVQRGLEGLWAGLWEPPSATGSDAKSAAAALRALVGRPLGAPVAPVRHTLTHREIYAQVYRPARSRLPAATPGRCFADPLAAPLSGLARKVVLAAAGALAA